MGAEGRHGVTASGPLAFNPDRPIEAIRVADPWRPYAHYIAVLPVVLERMSRQLGVGDGDRVLDYGCADAPYHRFFSSQVDVVGADLQGNPVADLVLDGNGRVPAADGAFDAVLSTQVLEHVGDPAAYLAECHRVLRPGGRLLLSTHGVFTFHPDPVDYWRWTSQGLRRVVEAAGFEIVDLEGVVGLGAMGIQFVLDTALPRIPTRLRPLAHRVTNAAMAFVDRRQGSEAKALNASVFVLVAEKPAR